MRRRYTYAGLVVASEVELIGLPHHWAPGATAISVSCALLATAPTTWVADPTNSWWSEADDDQGWWLQIAGQAMVWVADEGRRVSIEVAAGADPEFVSHLMVDFVLPICLDFLGRLVLHATAVEFNGGVVAFTAPSGGGKSTLAIATARRGGAMMADDALVVEQRGEQSWVQPTVATTRLRRDMADALFGDLVVGPAATLTGKHRVDLVGSGVMTAQSEAPLRSLIVLAPERSGPPTLRALDGSSAARIVLGNLFHRGSTRVHALSLMDRVISLVVSVRVFELVHERDFDSIDNLVQMALDTI